MNECLLIPLLILAIIYFKKFWRLFLVMQIFICSVHVVRLSNQRPQHPIIASSISAQPSLLERFGTFGYRSLPEPNTQSSGSLGDLWLLFLPLGLDTQGCRGLKVQPREVPALCKPGGEEGKGNSIADWCTINAAVL